MQFQNLIRLISSCLKVHVKCFNCRHLKNLLLWHSDKLVNPDYIEMKENNYVCLYPVTLSICIISNQTSKVVYSIKLGLILSDDFYIYFIWLLKQYRYRQNWYCTRSNIQILQFYVYFITSPRGLVEWICNYLCIHKILFTFLQWSVNSRKYYQPLGRLQTVWYNVKKNQCSSKGQKLIWAVNLFICNMKI